ncbi:unnamed protein product [Trichogramma brassicae]|uniref:Uncharacterized protein n=1 Tax=Trichogramma brassicae TaxID=86971 RepID=A0A6H5HV65_9HYME|nr:unnamed protein product [Trichogramma brassicae]
MNEFNRERSARVNPIDDDHCRSCDFRKIRAPVPSAFNSLSNLSFSSILPQSRLLLTFNSYDSLICITRSFLKLNSVSSISSKDATSSPTDDSQCLDERCRRWLWWRIALLLQLGP